MSYRSPLTLLIAAAVLALTAAPAAAKGVKSAELCGASECVPVDRGEFRDGEALFGGTPSDPPRHGEAWYSLRVHMYGHPGPLRFDAVPGSGYVRMPGEISGPRWLSMTADQQAIYRRLTTDLAPYPGEQLKGLGAPQLPAAFDRPPVVIDDSDDGGGSFPWLIVLGGLAAVALVAVLHRGVYRHHRAQQRRGLVV